MTPSEIAKDIMVALIHTANVSGDGDPQSLAKWVAKSYRIIYEAVLNPTGDTKTS